MTRSGGELLVPCQVNPVVAARRGIREQADLVALAAGSPQLTCNSPCTVRGVAEPVVLNAKVQGSAKTSSTSAPSLDSMSIVSCIPLALARVALGLVVGEERFSVSITVRRRRVLASRRAGLAALK